MNKPASNLASRSFLSIALSRIVVVQAIKVAIVVGTILALINHGDKILDQSISVRDCLKVILSYLVPYAVSTWSAVGAIKADGSKGN